MTDLIEKISLFLYKSRDYRETEELKCFLRNIKANRDPFFLTETEFHQIALWKLGNQFNRNKHNLDNNITSCYKLTTTAAFSITESDDYSCATQLKINILTTLHGVGIPVASAALALVEPERYCVIDFRGWRQLFQGGNNLEKKKSFNIDDYIKYLDEIRRIAVQLKSIPQEVDLAIWELDLRENP
ncbi:MAG: hypothetical protein HQL56_04585 [Magnetococcales bacterium]|nr:hypothetical protein [Magnetococcales bacterium]